MSETGQHFDYRAGNGTIIRGGRGSPSAVFLAENHQERLAEGRQPIGKRLLLHVAAAGPRRGGERVESHGAHLVQELHGDLVALTAESGARELAKLFVAHVRPLR
jgi:hypothetical protein